MLTFAVQITRKRKLSIWFDSDGKFYIFIKYYTCCTAATMFAIPLLLLESNKMREIIVFGYSVIDFSKTFVKPKIKPRKIPDYTSYLMKR